jgi:hypothetical protein
MYVYVEIEFQMGTVIINLKAYREFLWLEKFKKILGMNQSVSVAGARVPHSA